MVLGPCTRLTRTLKTLPASAGGSITYMNDFNPTWTSRPAGTVASTSTTPTSSITGSTTPSDSATSTLASQAKGGGLDTGAKVGIGIGTIGVVALIAAVGLLALIVARRQRTRQATTATTTTTTTGHPNNNDCSAVATPGAGAPLPPYPGDGGMGIQQTTNYNNNGKTPAWSPGNIGNNTTMYQTGFKYELPADASSGVVAASAVSPSLSTVSPDHHNAGSPGSTGCYVLPQSTGNTGTGYYGEGNTGHSGHISELHG